MMSEGSDCDSVERKSAVLCQKGHFVAKHVDIDKAE